MNFRHQRILKWNDWHNMFDVERPSPEEVVDVVLPNRAIRVAVYDKRFENEFRVGNEALSVKPIAWRRRSKNGQIIARDMFQSVPAEVQTESVPNG